MEKYILGIDTGGTFTDGVVIQRGTAAIIATAKSPTTHHQLSNGVSTVVHDLLHKASIEPEQIDSLSVSTTLATNSVVEGKGARVALIVVGYVKHFKLPVKAVIFIKGGHTITGEEEEPLEIEYLVSLLEKLRDEVDAYGICSAMAIKNPAHELVAEKAISLIDPKPVFCSHQISSQTGMKERAATAGLHAKLMPIMKQFISGVQYAMADKSVTCPLLIIGGNTDLLDADKAVNHAGLTVASGPACTAYFGATHCKTTALIVDVGGTTTDISMVVDGKPVMAAEGCRIGDWKTHVEAVDMSTKGIGGDSHILLDAADTIHIGPNRVVPLAVSEHALDIRDWLGREGASKCIRLIAPANDPENNIILTTLKETGPCTREQLKKITGLSGVPLEKQLENLSRLQLIEETGFTPTDALHVLGKISIGDGSRSILGAEILGLYIDLKPEAFAECVIEKTVEKIETSLLQYITEHYWQNSLSSFISTHKNHPVLGVQFSLKIPLIGIGAAAPFFLPQVAKRLKTSVTFPENYEVGNALGAALLAQKYYYE